MIITSMTPVKLEDINTNVGPSSKEELYTNGLYEVMGLTVINKDTGELMLHGHATKAAGIKRKDDYCWFPVFHRGTDNYQQFKTIKQIRNEKLNELGI